MILISHRGNINGINVDLENTKEYIDSAIKKGYDVEIDIWYKDFKLYLGHDLPQYDVDINWLLERKNKLWIHTKNFFALKNLLNTELKLFFHEKESHSIISNTKLIWSHKLSEADESSIIPLLDLNSIKEYHIKNYKVAGICSDFIEKIK
jgi:hypothetical protein